MNTNINISENKYKLDIGSFLILFGLILTVVIQFFIETPYYSIAKLVLYIVFFFGIVMYIPTFRINKNYFLMFFLISIFLTVINWLLLSLVTTEQISEVAIQIVLPFVFLILGYNSSISLINFKKTLEIYILTTTVLGLYIIFSYGEGFNVTQSYFFASKNQVGPFIAISCMMCVYSLFSKKNKMLFTKKRYLILLLIINFTILLTIRNRSGIVALLISMFFYWAAKSNFRIKKTTLVFFPIIFIIIEIFLNIGVFTPIIDYMYDSFFLSFDVSDINSFSAGRTDGYLESLNFISSSPFFGELSDTSGITIDPHNYLLNILTKFGIFGFFPLVGLYLYLWGFAFKRILISREEDISLYLLLLILIISLFEPTYPYSPMTTVSLPWLLLGNYLRPNQSSNWHNY